MPLSITARITIALEQVRIARRDGDLDREWAWTGMLDRLLGTHAELLKASGRYKSLKESDPELDARLTVKLSFKLIGRGTGGVAPKSSR